jgi:hypothetical protein
VARREPTVRIRCPQADAARCRSLLAAAGLSGEGWPGGLAVREAEPDAVNEILVRGGAQGRAVAREQVGRLVGFVLDRQGELSARGPALRQIVRRALAEAGLESRYRPRGEPALCAAAGALLEHLLATGGGFVPWDRFVEEFCEPATAAPA